MSEKEEQKGKDKRNRFRANLSSSVKSLKFSLDSNICRLLYRSSRSEVSCKKDVLRNFTKLQESNCARVSFLMKLQACNFIKKENLAQVFSREFCEISKNTFFHRIVLVAASDFMQVKTHCRVFQTLG